MEGRLAVCPTDFFNINKYRKLHFKLKYLPRQRCGRCLFSIALMFNRVVFLCSEADITEYLLILGQFVISLITLIMIAMSSCNKIVFFYFFLPAVPEPY